MRRSSNHLLQTQTSEPMIVVEELHPMGGEPANRYVSRESSEDEPALNPYLLSPYAREIRKQSLPTPQCSGITASQVRRLSERSETAGPGPRQTEFLATLSSAPTPNAGGRRHSVVTISKVPTTLFGRSRRDSMVGYPPGRVLPNRRESIACPPSTEPRGSVHNLQLDIMDDILQARKVRMKLWNTSSERFCEVQPLDETSSGTVQRYSNSSGRRYSDFVGTTLAPIPSSNKRRASELPQALQQPLPGPGTSSGKRTATGIVCSNTDLISILSLSTSATEIDQIDKSPKSDLKASANLDQKRSRLKSHRSNSFDVSVLHGVSAEEGAQVTTAPSNWFAKRHQPLSAKTECSSDRRPSSPRVSFAPDCATQPPQPQQQPQQQQQQPQQQQQQQQQQKKGVVEKEPSKVMWDERSGSLVDAQALGSAIEVFLRQGSPDSSQSPTSVSPSKSEKTPAGKSPSGRAKTSWFSSRGNDDSTETCDSSLCSTLKDLFVK